MRVTEALPAAQGGNRVTETVYNADGSVHQVKRAVGTALTQTYATTTYSANGLPVTLTDAKGNRTTYEYDGHDRRVKLRYPHPTTVGTSSTTDYEQFGYNAVGSLISHRKRSGETITLAYDNLHRLTSRSYPTAADNVAFAYELLGRRTQARYADNSHTVAYVWDAAGRLTSTAAGGKTLAYQYDAAANAIGLTCFISRFLRRPLDDKSTPGPRHSRGESFILAGRCSVAAGPPRPVRAAREQERLRCSATTGAAWQMK